MKFSKILLGCFALSATLAAHANPAYNLRFYNLGVTAPEAPAPATPAPDAPPPAPPAPTDPDISKVSLLLHFDGTPGAKVFTDSSGHATSSTISGAPALSSNASMFGGTSLALNGSSSVAFNTATGSDATSDFTVEYWLKTGTGCCGSWATVLRGGFVFTKFETTSGSWYGNTQVYTGDLYFEIGAGGGNSSKMVVSRNGKWNDGNWHHIAVSRASGVLRGFVDGTQQLPALNSNWAYPVMNASLGQGVTGYIDEVRITNGRARYTAPFSVPTAAFPDN